MSTTAAFLLLALSVLATPVGASISDDALAEWRRFRGHPRYGEWATGHLRWGLCFVVVTALSAIGGLAAALSLLA